MNRFDRFPNLFRVLLLPVAIFLMGMVLINFFRYTGSPTDENIFITTPSRLIFNRSIATISSDNKKNFAASTAIETGDLLLTVQGIFIGTPSILATILKETKGKNITIRIYRPTANRVYKYIVHNSDGIDSCIDQIPQTVCIVAITQNGASDRAGLKQGDLIFKINGESFRTDLEADMVLRKASKGKPIVYQIYRKNQITTLNVVLANFGINIFFLTLFLIGIVYFFTGLFIGLKLSPYPAGRLIGLMFIFLGTFISMVLIQRDVNTDPFVVLKNYTMAFSCILGALFWVHSFLYFPQRRADLIRHKLWLVIPYGTGLLTAIILIFYQGWYLAFLFSLILITFLIIFMAAHRKGETNEYKKLLKYLKWTYITLSIYGLYTMAIPLLRFPNFLMPIQGLFFLMVPVAYLYTIARFGLYNINFRIKRNVQYSISISIWFVALAAMFIHTITHLSSIHLDIPNIVITGTSIEILKNPLSPEKYQAFENTILMLSAILLAYLFIQIAGFGKRWIDRKYYRSRYDYKRVANIITSGMATKLGASDLSRWLVTELAQLMHLKSTGVIFFENQQSCKSHEIYGHEKKEWQSYCKENFKSLLELIESSGGQEIIDTSELDDRGNQSVKDFAFKKIIPTYSNDRLMGILFIGEKLSETPFYPEDIEILTGTARQAALAIENVNLYEELAGQEKLKHELEIARNMQLSMLPEKMPRIDGLDIIGSSMPAKRVGGDYYDFLNGHSDEITIIVGDVSGKGISAAFYQSKVQGVFRSLNGFNLSLKELFVKANQILYKNLDLKAFVTAVGSQFYPRKKELVLTRAGHMPLFQYDSNQNKVHAILPKGLGLGLEDRGKFQDLLEERTIAYQTGDVFLFVSDGITEARDINGNEFGETRLQELLLLLNERSSQEIKDSILEKVFQFSTDTEQHDDQTIVVVKAV